VPISPPARVRERLARSHLRCYTLSVDLIVGGVAVVVVGTGAVGTLAWRRVYVREMPLQLWGLELDNAERAARVLAEATGLDVERQNDGLAWVAALFLAPIWFIWGDLRTRRPERHLARWRLHGKRAAGREVRITLGPDGSLVAVASSGSDGIAVDLSRPLEHQEGLRGLHPVGGERWQRSLAHFEALTHLGLTRLRLDGGMLVGELPLEPRAGMAGYASALGELEALAALLEQA
jgi:hypothetical protein